MSKQIQAYYDIDPFQSKASVQVKYTLGTYVIPNRDARGQLELSPSKGLTQVRVAFAVQGFKSNDTTLDCHLQESLGLDYNKSDFPGSHVCKNDRLPTEGKNAIAYPEIEFTSSDAKVSFAAVTEAPTTLTAQGKWTLHGVERPATLTLTVQKVSGGYRVSGKSPLSLKEFGVVVKNFLLISVKDEVQAEWQVVFKEEGGK